MTSGVGADPHNSNVGAEKIRSHNVLQPALSSDAAPGGLLEGNRSMGDAAEGKSEAVLEETTSRLVSEAIYEGVFGPLSCAPGPPGCRWSGAIPKKPGALSLRGPGQEATDRRRVEKIYSLDRLPRSGTLGPPSKARIGGGPVSERFHRQSGTGR